MPIRIAIALKASDAPSIAKLKEALVDGVESAWTDAAALKPALDAAGLPIACLTTDIALHHKDRREWDRASSDLSRAIDAARAAGAPVVRVFGRELPRGEAPGVTMSRIAERLPALIAAADAAKTTLAIQNAGNFLLARDLWQLLETIADPRVGVALDIAASALADESPVLAVPTLNSRVAYVRVWDHKDGKPANFGEGVVKNKAAIERLRGIGYDGWITYAPPAGIDLSNLDALKAIIHQIKLWAGLIAPPTPPAEPKPAAAKPAAPAAAKPASPTATGAAGPAAPKTPNASSDATPSAQGTPSQAPTKVAVELAKDPTVSAAPQSTSEKPS